MSAADIVGLKFLELNRCLIQILIQLSMSTNLQKILYINLGYKKFFFGSVLQRWMVCYLGTEKEYTELLTGASHRIDKVEGLRIRGANHSFIRGSHIQHLSTSPLLCLRITRSSWNNACTGGNRLDEFQNRAIPLGRLASDGEPGSSSIAVHGPDGDGEERERGGSVRSVLVAFQGYSQQAVLHLLGQGVRGQREFQQHERRATGVFLDAEADAPFALPEDGASNSRSQRGRGCCRGHAIVVVVRRGRAGAAGGQHKLHQRSERPPASDILLALHGGGATYYLYPRPAALEAASQIYGGPHYQCALGLIDPRIHPFVPIFMNPCCHWCAVRGNAGDHRHQIECLPTRHAFRKEQGGD